METVNPLNDIHTVKAFAKNNTRYLSKQGYEPSALHRYDNEQGNPILYVAKVKNKATGEKQFRPISLDAEGNLQSKQPDWSSLNDGNKYLYNLPMLTTDTNSPVYIVEGEKDADNLNKLGILATTCLNGANSVNSTDWSTLAGREVVIWRDNDDAGTNFADAVIEHLSPLECHIAMVDVEQLNLPIKGDASDWIAIQKENNISNEELKALIIGLPSYAVNQLEAVEDDAELTDEQTDTLIAELAELSVVAYERKRSDVAKLIGVRANILDKLVKEARKALEGANDDIVPYVATYDKPVNGEHLLNEIVELINSVVVCEPATADAVGLWVFFSWCIDAFDIAPIACITAPEKRCGKTVLLTLIGKMVKRPLEASFISPASLFRIVEAQQPTLLIDEADAFMKQDEEMRGLINLGHQRGKQVLRCVGDDNDVRGFKVYGAKVISGIGHLPDTIRDRSIILELRRKLAHETRLRMRDIDNDAIELIKAKLARWSNDHLQQLYEARPPLPTSINDRSQDNWEGLLAIAMLISDDWFKRATDTAVMLSGTLKDEPSTNEILLADIKEVFEKLGCETIFTSILIEELCDDEEKVWCSYNFKSNDKRIKPSQIAKRLKEYGIKSRDIRSGFTVKKGYRKSDFKDAFARYLAVPPFTDATTLQVNDSKGYSQKLDATNSHSVADKKTLKPNNHVECSVVASRNTPSEDVALKSQNVATKSSEKQTADLPQLSQKNVTQSVAENDNLYQNAQHVSQVTFTTHTDENGRTYQVPSSRGIIV